MEAWKHTVCILTVILPSPHSMPGVVLHLTFPSPEYVGGCLSFSRPP